MTDLLGGKTVPNDIPRDELTGSHAATVQSTSGEGFDLRDFRNALGTFGTGVTIITARGRDAANRAQPGSSGSPRMYLPRQNRSVGLGV